MKTLAIILLTFTFPFVCFSSEHNSANPSSYMAFTTETKIPVFVDEFEDNRNNWSLGIKENVWLENLESGKLVFQSLENVAKEDYKKIYIDQNKDFEIELSIRFDKGKTDEANGLQWGKSEDGKQFDFMFTGNGQYTIDKYNGEFHDFVSFTPSPIINRYAFNKLTVRKMSNEYYFFINEQLVHNMPFEPFFGDGIGFQVGSRSSIEVDYLRVTLLRDNSSPGLAKINIDESKFFSPSGKVEKGLPITSKITLKNNSDVDAHGVRLHFQLPDYVLLLESEKEITIPANSSKDIRMAFYINSNFEQEDIDIKLALEAAELDFERELSLLLNQIISTDQDRKYAIYRGGGDPLKGLNAAKVIEEVSIGKYYAVIIGIDEYSGEWKKLRNAVNDAKSVEKVLKDKYQFDDVKTLYNEEATRENIIRTFEWLMQVVKENDNVFLFYSGHGEYINDLSKGFWVPVDATENSVVNYISNSDIQLLLKGIKSKHTLLVTDACFSGDIFRGKTLTIPYENSSKYYNTIYSKISRKALTSGNIEPVMDGGKEGHSVFSYYLLQTLQANQSKFYDASQLYNDLKTPVVNNSRQMPMFNPILNTGDEGGQFIFILK